ncbi:hypothetical protein NC652_040130 [Populus alba x Populus x berolinensis]|uniref:Uncharacterized protein n=1 Tax=Populus alba x Populus x berolinensis TaxID=444605 RepID=A0AAD6PRF0_9ROSI|nr:hypothetical protein NC652_040130 [Populus alba x Populus x berolinensis]KAJ6958408.1 hypothetical protein NC653_040146 [Populus alba x Populus x berolinensis]
MGSQGKARYLTIILLIVTIILLSCSNLTVIASRQFPCTYDPKDGKCIVGEPAATKFDGGRS